MSELRSSIADPVEPLTDPEQKARREAENGVRQFEAARDAVKKYTYSQKAPFDFGTR